MNEVKKIHLDRQQFTISIEAHKALRDYLAAIEKQPGVQDEVIKEVEMRMAELLTERGATGEKVVLAEDVDFLKEQLGEPRDFKDDDGEAGSKVAAEDEMASTAPRQLYRDPEHGMVAGVAAGLATYFNVDVLIVRLLFVVLSFVGTAGIVLYVLLWILAPEAKTSSDRLKMRGKAVTVDSIKEAVDRADIPGTTRRAGHSVGRAAHTVGSGVAKLIAVLFGSFFTGIGSVIMVGTGLIGAMLLVSGFDAGDVVLFPITASDYVALAAAILTGLVLGLMIVLGGISLVRRKGVVGGWVVAGLAGLFLLTASVGAAMGFDGVHRTIDRFREAHHTYRRTLPTFTRAELNGHDTRFVFKPGKEYAVELSYLGKLDEQGFSTTVENGTFKMDTNKFADPLCRGFCTGFNDRDLEVTIYAPNLEEVRIEGDGASFSNDAELTQQNLTVTGDKGSDIWLRHMRPQQLDVTFNKTGERTKKLQLSGLQPGASRDERIQAQSDDDIIRVDNAQDVTLQTDMACEGHNPILFVGMVPRELRLQDKVIKSMDELRSLRSYEQNTVYNCVDVPGLDS